MKTRIAVGVMAVLLALYIVLVAQRAWMLLLTGEPIAIAMGAVLFLLPVVAIWALARELWFGVRAERVGRRLDEEGGLPADEVGVHPSGRVERDDADAAFPAYKAQVEADPDDWRAWYRVGLAYDGAGDRRRARAAIRQSIRLEAAERRAQRAR